MAKKISKAEIAEADIFGDIKRSAEETIEVIDKLSDALTETADAVKKSVGGAKFDSTKAIDNFVKSTEKANKLQKQSIELTKAKANAVTARKKAMSANQKVLQDQERTVQARIKSEEAMARQKARVNKEGERAKRVAAAENSEYKKLVKRTRDLKNESKELAAKMILLESNGKKNTTAYREMARTYRSVTKEAKAGDVTLKKIDSTVGDNFRNVGNYTGALKKLGTGLATLAGGFGVMKLLRGATDIVVNFDQAQADLLAVSGKTAEEMKVLTAQAKELGATTQFSATQITEMQIELAKLGFTQSQIEKSTKSVANFAAATGADIPSAAKLAGSALRGFGLDASEMDRVTSVLGVATTKTALSFESLNSAMGTVAPVANAFGFSIEDSTALLGQLANAGFDASSAATATKNILLNLADSNGELAKQLGRPITSADDLAAGLQELQDKGINLSEALELTDRRSVAAFETFLKGSDKLVELRDSITDVNSELGDMAEKKLDTIGGQFTLLQSAWEGFILSVNEGSGAGEAIKNMLSFIAANLTQIMGVIGRVVVAWGAYKAALIAGKAASFLMSGGLKEMAKAMIAQVAGLKNIVKGQKAVTKGSKEMENGVKSAGKAMNAVPWMLIIGLIVEMGTALWDAASGAWELEAANKALEEGRAQGEKIAALNNAALQKRIKLELQKIDLKLAKGEIDQNEALKLRQELYKKETKGINDQIDANWKKKKSLEVVRAEQEKEKKAFEAYAVTAAGLLERQFNPINFAKKQLSFTTKLNEIGKRTESLTKQNNELAAAREGLSDITKDLVIEEINLNGETKRGLGLGKGQVKKEKEIQTEFKASIDLLDEYNTLLSDRRQLEQDLLQMGVSDEAKKLEDKIGTELETQRVSAETTGEIDVDKLEEMVDLKSAILQHGIRQDSEFEAAEIERTAAEFNRIRRANLEAEHQELKKGAEGHADELEQIETNHQIELMKIKALEAEEAANRKLEIKKIRKDAASDIEDIERESADEVKAINDELIQEQINYANNQRDLMKGLNKDAEDAAKKAADAEAQMWQDRMDMAQVATDFLTLLSDRRIKKLDEEISEAQKQADFLRGLAESGNIEAKDSLAEQQRIIDEANRKKLQEEKLKAKIEFANTVFQTYGQKVQAGSESPLADTVKDVSLLQQFIAKFTPTYLEGTEDTGSNGQGIDGKGGFHAILHPNERVLTKEQNKAIGSLSNDSLAKVAQDYQNGKIMQEGASQIGGGWESIAIVQRLESLEQTIKDKPEHSLRVEDVVTGAMTIVRETKKGNTLNYNRYRVKK